MMIDQLVLLPTVDIQKMNQVRYIWSYQTCKSVQTHGCDKSGRISDFHTYLTGEVGFVNVPFISFRGNWFNVLFYNGGILWLYVLVMSCTHFRVNPHYSCPNVKELLARSRCEIWSLNDCNWTRTQNHLVRVQLQWNSILSSWSFARFFLIL